jgi:hypothetical protein
MLQVDQGYQGYQGSNGAPGWVKPAAGAAAGGTVILLAARRRKRKKREAEARSLRGRARRVAGTVAREAVPAATKGATVVATKAAPVAKGAQGKVAQGLDRIAEDRKVRTYALAGIALVWFLISWSELRQLRKLNRRVAGGTS